MQQKVKFFDTLDEEINAWIENYDKEMRVNYDKY